MNGTQIYMDHSTVQREARIAFSIHFHNERGRIMSHELPIVEISFDGSLIHLYVPRDDDEAEFDPTEQMPVNGLGKVKRANARPPFASNFRALLKCGGGTFQRQGETFRIKLVAHRMSSFGGDRRMVNRSLPSPDFSAAFPESCDSAAKESWSIYEKTEDKGDTFFRYVRFGLAQCGIVSLGGVQSISLSYVTPTDPSLTHVDHRSTASAALILNISGVSTDFDDHYGIKLIPNETKFKHEVLANNILQQNTDHGAFLLSSFAFRCRLTNTGANQYAIAVRLEDTINLRQACEPAHIQKLALSEIEILSGLQFLLQGRMSVDTRVEPRSDGRRMQWAHGDHHNGNIIVWRSHHEGFRRFAYIDFANSDIVHQTDGLVQRLYGGRGRKTDSGNLLTPSAVSEAQELVAMFVQLLHARNFGKSARFLSELGLACTLPAAYNAVTARLNELESQVHVPQSTQDATA